MLLFSEGMTRFYECFREDLSTIEECFERFKIAIPFVANELNLGRLEMVLLAPVSRYDANGTRMETAGYTYEGGYEEESLEYSYSTGEHGKVIIRVMPRIGHKWNDDEKQALNTFAMNLFFLGGRARLIDMMRKSAITDITTGVDNVDGLMKYAGEVSYKEGLEKYFGIRFNIKNFSSIASKVSKMRIDDYMRNYANCIKDFLKDNGRLARLGGDNYIALVRNEWVDRFVDFIKKISIKIDNREVKLCARMGIYDIQHKDNIGDVMTNVDIALSAVKLQNKDIVRYEEVCS